MIDWIHGKLTSLFMKRLTACQNMAIWVGDLTYFYEQMTNMTYMIIEQFKDGKIKEVYRRFGEQGRLMPDELYYVNSWISDNLSTCYQVMQTENYESLKQWMDNWKDLIDFTVTPVITSQEAMERI
jgi:hypothetical protein